MGLSNKVVTSEFKESNFSRVLGLGEARSGSFEVRHLKSIDYDYTLKKLDYDRKVG